MLDRKQPGRGGEAAAAFRMPDTKVAYQAPLDATPKYPVIYVGIDTAIGIGSTMQEVKDFNRAVDRSKR